MLGNKQIDSLSIAIRANEAQSWERASFKRLSPSNCIQEGVLSKRVFNLVYEYLAMQLSTRFKPRRIFWEDLKIVRKLPLSGLSIRMEFKIRGRLASFFVFPVLLFPECMPDFQIGAGHFSVEDSGYYPRILGDRLRARPAKLFSRIR